MRNNELRGPAAIELDIIPSDTEHLFQDAAYYQKAMMRYHCAILEMRTKLDVLSKDLAVRFGVSLESIRRDLSQLERQGAVRKFYGGAELVEDHLPDGEAAVFQVRLTEHWAEKCAIARQVNALIGDGETIYLDSGTTAGALLPYLKERRGLTVITRSLRNAAQLGMCEHLTVYCIGGAV